MPLDPRSAAHPDDHTGWFIDLILGLAMAWSAVRGVKA